MSFSKQSMETIFNREMCEEENEKDCDENVEKG